MAIPPEVNHLRNDMFALNLNWEAGNISEDEFRQDLTNLDQRVTELATQMPHFNLNNDKQFIDHLKAKINWADRGFQTQKLNGFLSSIANVIRKIFG